MSFTEKASERARRLAEAAMAKAEQYGVRERVVEYGGKAAEIAGRGVDAATAGIDKATGGRFHDQIDTVHTKVGETLHRARGAGGDAGPTLAPGAAPDAVAETTGPQPGGEASLAPGAAPDAVAGTTGSAAGTGPSVAPGAAPDAVAETTGPPAGAAPASTDAVGGQDGEPITPASTNPDAKRPGTA